MFFSNHAVCKEKDVIAQAESSFTIKNTKSLIFELMKTRCIPGDLSS